MQEIRYVKDDKRCMRNFPGVHKVPLSLFPYQLINEDIVLIKDLFLTVRIVSIVSIVHVYCPVFQPAMFC